LNGKETEVVRFLSLGAFYRQGRGDMPSDPKECRMQARCCADLAFTAATPHAREHFASLATSWIKLALELEGAQAFLSALDEIEADEFSNSEAA
jgi:hypothetical protein